jgi:molecular chaperone DnaK (HSP70)
MAGQHHDVAATAGVSRLGGDDFDEVLMGLVLQQVGMAREQLEATATARLLEACRDAKEGLNPNSRRAVIDLQAAMGDAAPMADVSVATDAYYLACEPLVERTLQAMAPVVSMGDVQAAPEDPAGGGVAGFYVVGGASALPVVGRMLRKRYGRRVHRSPYPSAVTAIGVAIAADPASGFGLTDRFSRAFGVFRELQGGAIISFDPIFTRDTRMPQAGAAPVVSSRTYRAAHNIGHFRYVECAGLDDAGAPLGDTTPFAELLFPFDAALAEEAGALRDIPVQRLRRPGPLVMEQYAVDSNGIVSVTIRNLDTGYERTFRVWAAE